MKPVSKYLLYTLWILRHERRFSAQYVYSLLTTGPVHCLKLAWTWVHRSRPTRRVLTTAALPIINADIGIQPTRYPGIRISQLVMIMSFTKAWLVTVKSALLVVCFPSVDGFWLLFTLGFCLIFWAAGVFASRYNWNICQSVLKSEKTRAYSQNLLLSSKALSPQAVFWTPSASNYVYREGDRQLPFHNQVRISYVFPF